jgi:fumarylpyruvate hydrolase
MSNLPAAKHVGEGRTYLFKLPSTPSAKVKGEARLFPINRIFCVGRNYAEHAIEMGVEVDREAPFYFTKAATAIVPSGAEIGYPPGTANYHYEMEFVVALGAAAFEVKVEKALDSVFGYAAGLDMTRRDLQLDARAKGRPWDLGKAFEQSAVLGDIVRRDEFGDVENQRIELKLNGEIRQQAKLSDLVWSVSELVSHLSHYYHLEAGDLIYTGTPAGVGAVVHGDILVGTIDGLPPVSLSVSR